MTVSAAERPCAVSADPGLFARLPCGPAAVWPHSDDPLAVAEPDSATPPRGLLQADGRFAVVAERIIDAPISEAAFRL